MASRFQRGAVAISVIIGARILLGLIANPMDDVRTDLERDLRQVPAGAATARDHKDFAAIQNILAAKALLWQPLIPAPEVPKENPVAAPGPQAPDLAALLKDVSVGRGQIGEGKIRLHTAENPKGEWVAVGAVINGCTLESFTPEQVIFTYQWKEGGKELSIALSRP